MTLVTSAGGSNQNILNIFSGTFTILSATDTGFSVTGSVGAATISGSGLTYSFQQQGNLTLVSITGGTITGVTQTSGVLNQTWTGFSIPGATASDDIANQNYLGFDNLFFGGADVFNYTSVAGFNVFLQSYDGDDVFNINNINGRTGTIDVIGGNGNDTLNLSGGVAATITGFQQAYNFNPSGIEHVNLAGGADYTLIVPTFFGLSGGTVLDASALGASNHLIVNSVVLGGGTYVGNVTIIGGGGDDTFMPGSGTNVFDGGGGTNTVDFSNFPKPSGMTINLNLSTPQSLGYLFASGTFVNIQNLINVGGNATITGDAGNNVISGGGGNSTFSGGGGNDTFILQETFGFHTSVNGGSGTDIAVLSAPRGNYTLSVSGGVTTLTDPLGTTTLTNVEFAQFSDQTVQISGIVVTTSNVAASRNQTFALSSLFSATDLSGNAITAYQVFDGSADPLSGHFVINGVVQAERTVINVSAAQLAQTSYVAGKMGENLQIRATDGIDWSAPDNAGWAPFTVTIPNAAPVLTTSDKAPLHGQTLALSSLFSVSDADNDTITKYQLFDGNNDPLSGHFLINGVAQAERAVIDVSAAQLAQTAFVTGTVNDPLQIRASDGIDWSASDNVGWSPFTVAVQANHAPVVTTSNVAAQHVQTIPLSSLITVSDAENDSITRYQLFDGTAGSNSGHFVVNGTAQPERSVLDITAAQVVQTSFVTGFVNDALQIRAYDGTDWSASDNVGWSPFTVSVPTNHAPVVVTGNIAASHNQTITLSSLMTASDADSDILTRYQLFDGTSDPLSGHFVVNGVAQAERTVLDITASQLGQTSFVTGFASDNLQIRAYDGAAWSASDNVGWAPFTVSVPANHAPVVATANVAAQHSQTIALSNLITVSDSDNDTIIRYQLFDGTSDPSSGHFMINGVVQAERTVLDISASQVAQTSFVAGFASDNLQIRAYDGLAWSAPDNAGWSPFVVSVPAEHAPVVSTVDLSLPHSQSQTLASLFSVSDADSDPITMYQLFDGTADPNSGHFVVAGVAQAERSILEITASQLAQTSFMTGSTMGDDVQIRAFDGNTWSAPYTAGWSPFHISVT